MALEGRFALERPGEAPSAGGAPFGERQALLVDRLAHHASELHDAAWGGAGGGGGEDG